MVVAPSSPRAAPKAGSAWESEAAGDSLTRAHWRLKMAAVGFKVAAGVKRYGFASLRRLKTPAEFSALLRAPRERSIRGERQMLSLNATWVAVGSMGDAAGSARFGVTVGKRNARRAVDRMLFKRIVREACRHYASEFENCAARAAARIDIALRLRAPLVDADGVPLAMSVWRRQVRADADGLLQDALARLTARLATNAAV